MPTRRTERRASALPPRPAPSFQGGGPSEDKIEADTVDDSHDIASGFIGIEGVTGINLVYANFEDDPTLAEAGTR